MNSEIELRFNKNSLGSIIVYKTFAFLAVFQFPKENCQFVKILYIIHRILTPLLKTIFLKIKFLYVGKMEFIILLTPFVCDA